MNNILITIVVTEQQLQLRANNSKKPDLSKMDASMTDPLLTSPTITITRYMMVMIRASIVDLSHMLVRLRPSKESASLQSTAVLLKVLMVVLSVIPLEPGWKERMIMWSSHNS